jgi:hypothetical protein
MTELIEAVGIWWWPLAIVVLILGPARLSRIVVHDLFPPAAWLRQRWSDWVVKHNHESWGPLLFCFWCFTPWVTLVALGWFVLGLYVTWILWFWWFFWGWLAIAYVGSIVLAYDSPQEDETQEDES